MTAEPITAIRTAADGIDRQLRELAGQHDAAGAQAMALTWRRARSCC